MIMDNISVFGLLRSKMSWLTDRQRVLADNIANANTPGYSARDLERPNFKNLLRTQTPRMISGATHANHIPIKAGASETTNKPEKAPDWETTPDGNSVVLEDQMMKVAQNQMEYQSAVDLYRKSVDMIRLAISSR